MPNIIEIASLDDPALEPYAKLTENQLRQRQHAEKGVFIAESVPVITQALNAGLTPLSLLMERRQIDGAARDIVNRCGDIPLYTADDAVLEQLTGYSLSRGVLAVFRRPILPSVEEVCKGASRVAVLENVMDAANVGAMMRSAAALGMDAVLVSPGCSDPLRRRAVRVSMGTVFQIPWTFIGDRSDSQRWPEYGMELLHRLGFRTAALALRDDTLSVDDPRLKQAERLAVILGTEATGLCEETIRLSDYTVKIPMYHGVDSLNVAAASAVAFWETRRIQHDS